ncbi:hypothetical protein ZWY2020_015031 [Hordeum vulgare]|nr:hypothetical protein ZWY2020_015031 [Hordeum vulgare]
MDKILAFSILSSSSAEIAGGARAGARSGGGTGRRRRVRGDRDGAAAPQAGSLGSGDGDTMGGGLDERGGRDRRWRCAGGEDEDGDWKAGDERWVCSN